MKHFYQVTVLTATAAILLLCLHPASLFAQVSTGAVAQISGSVSDPAGAVVPGATVTATQTDTGFTRAAITGDDGSYVLPSLIIGPYKLDVVSSGFKTYSQKGIVLQVSDSVTVNVKLEVGSTSQSITVTADASMVNTESSSISTVIENNRVEDLPLNGRNLTQLVLLAGAAVSTNFGDYLSSKNYPTSLTIQVAGGEAAGTGYIVDGGGAYNDLYGGANLPLPFPDATQEFSVQTSMIPAQFGGFPGGVVNLVTKSGTNSFHGDLFEYIRNGDVDAIPYFATAQDTLRRNQFGGTLGGPVFRKKLFFFGGYQGTISRTAPATSTFFVPTAAALNGDFSAYESSACTSSPITLKNPAGGNFTGNQINPATYNAQAVSYVNKYIPPTTNPCGKILIGIPNPSNEYQYIGRVDWTANTRNTVFGRYFNSNYSNPPVYLNNNLLDTTRTGIYMEAQEVTAGDTYTLTQKMINSLHLTWTRLPLTRGAAPTVPSAATLGLSIGPAPPGNTPSTGVTGGFSTSCGTCAHAYVNRNQEEVRDDISWIHGRHQIAFGGLYERMHLNENFATLNTGSFSFNGSFTGLGLADFLLGDTSSFSQGSAQIWQAAENMYGLYIQDNFRMSKRLTLLGGVRWSPYNPPYDVHNRTSYFDQAAYTAGQKSTQFVNAPPGVFFPGDTIPGEGAVPAAGMHGRHWDFAPRVGLAWDPTGSGLWSVRASYGLFFADPEMANFEVFSYIAPYGNQVSLTSPAGGWSNPYSAVPGGDPFPRPFPPPSSVSFVPAAEFYTMPLHMHQPNTQQWNLSVQRQVGGDLLVTANYLGNKSTHRWIGYQLDPSVYIPGTWTGPGSCGALTVAPGPNGTACSPTNDSNAAARRVLTLENPTAGAGIGTIPFNDDAGNAEYDALFLTANRRFNHHFSILANYTWSHCLSEGEQDAEGGGGSIQNPANIAASRANCNSDIRQIFNVSYVARSPHFQTPMMNIFFSNWEEAGLIGAQTGNWLTPTDGQDISLTNYGNDHPNVIANPVLSNKTTSAWFNTAAYAKEAYGTFGNAGSYSIQGPKSFTYDTQLSRSFKVLREGQNLLVRFEAFNVLNHPVFGNPGTSLASTSTFGKITASGSPRILEGSMKFTF